jgi:DNA-binding response OmpR family regulator
MKRILLISRNEMILSSLLNHLFEQGFDAMGALRDAEAVSFLKTFKPHLVVLAGAFTESEKTHLMEQLMDSSDVPIIAYRGSAKNLSENVNKALNK